MEPDARQTGNNQVRIGCAGWSIPKEHAGRFPEEGTHLERYARVFPAVEINSSFYRPHKPGTYERWAASVPEGFRFAVKVPKTITHIRRLRDANTELEVFLAECKHLGPKLGPLLVQLPPTLKFDEQTVDAFFSAFRERFSGDVACEPRHPTWFAPEPDAMLSAYQVARVAADPSIVPAAAEPGGWSGLAYYRLHGSPRIYYSAYSPDYLKAIAGKLAESVVNGVQTWCIFDNTAEGAATGDALAVMSGS
ncbi:MAG TPA: DUF72 domain-containing protein [Chloroflexia bacterium]|jgi:uncharacterized protein YecE (DUF72 family)